MLGEAHEIATGRLGSIRELIRAFVFTPAARMSIEIDDRTIQTDALMVAVANAPFTGAGLALAPDARLDDGRFDICVSRRFSRLGLLVQLGTIAAGRRHHSPRIDTYRSRRVQVAALRPLPVRADAMDLGTTPVGFVVLPADERVLRQTIRPAYRNAFELLVGALDRGRGGEPGLADTQFLVTDGAGGYRFDFGREVLYQDRPGTRERIGATGGLWTFVLEASPSARAPITRLFGARMLEEAIEERSLFTAGLLDLRPFVLARLRAERTRKRQ